ncbi:uncharacterized protein LOC116314961 isoform X1 [Oreochromis aureus]|uniref:uncharacterized protein LOC116314961 isoform X1 n=1 Tax=Oreochromis aureus TaxID=47969 RepID=UPI001953B795|nr:uncharacterized protein LOC116314961 isoform X1 [Oreochromis aureus]
MKAPSVSLLLGVCVLLLSALAVSAVSLQVSPNLQQIFKKYASSVSLSCVDDDGQTADGWKVMITTDDYSYDCADSPSWYGYGVGYYSFCILDSFFSSDHFYFCENSSGQQSDEVSISISGTRSELSLCDTALLVDLCLCITLLCLCWSDRSVILEIPALPVRAGSNVTLRCRNHRGSTVEAYFFINGSHVGPEHQSELIITNVQKSDEGVYSCSVGVDKESLKSFLRVREPAATSSFSPPPPFLPPCLLLLLLFPLCLY